MSVKAMVIDDEPMMTKLLDLVIRDNVTDDVRCFNDPSEAFLALMTEKVDFISLDHHMPQMTGTTLLKILRSVDGPNQKTPVLIFTAYIDEVKKHGVDMYENVLFLSKPIQDEKYLRNVKFAIEMNN